MIIAHIDNNFPRRKEPLQEHLELTEKYARDFGAMFGVGELASLLARVHDFGKCSSEFQTYIATAGDSEESLADDAKKRGPDHSSAGAQWLWNNSQIKGIGHLLAYAVSGHHAGLPDGRSLSRGCLSLRMQKTDLPHWEEAALRELPDSLRRTDVSRLNKEIRRFCLDGYSEFFLVRMLFSCLVDADFLATEAFMEKAKSNARKEGRPELAECLHRLQEHYAVLESNSMDTPVNEIRKEVKEDCVRAAEKDPGLFTLTVPTGGGKTLASMAFALRHAVKHGMKRIIYVIPYTSIIEQNAKVYRSVFGEDSVLEHHCNFDFDEAPTRVKLLAENWDAPIIVTTSVQFFESLHANKTSRCRKAHNMANAVIVFDEAQSLPTGLLKPCLRAMDELMKNYRSSVVLCTATQPTVTVADLQDSGLTSTPREIVTQGRNLENRLSRVCVHRIEGEITDEALTEFICQHESALAVVSTRNHARRLYEMLKVKAGDVSVFHLSALMCPEHRSDILSRVKDLLANHQRCYLVSTQLIEAGVDIDFPCVFREMAGVDSIAQAAGRCNREGRLKNKGDVYVFESADYMPPKGFLRTAAQTGRETVGLFDLAADGLSLDMIHKYFELLYFSQKNRLDLYQVVSGDEPKIPKKFCGNSDSILNCQFKTLGEQFKFIESGSTNIFIPYGEKGRELCEALRNAFAPSEQRKIARKLQRYSVSVYDGQTRDSEGRELTQLVHDVYRVLISEELNYSKEFGYTTQYNDSDFQI